MYCIGLLLINMSFTHIDQLYGEYRLDEYQVELNKLRMNKGSTVTCSNVRDFNSEVLEGIMTSHTILDISFTSCCDEFIIFVVNMYPKKRWNLIVTTLDLDRFFSLISMIDDDKIFHVLNGVEVNIDRSDIIQQYLGYPIVITTYGMNEDNYSTLHDVLLYGMKVNITRSKLNQCYCSTYDSIVANYMVDCGYKIVLHDAYRLHCHEVHYKETLLLVDKITLDINKQLIDEYRTLGVKIMCYTRISREDMELYYDYSAIPKHYYAHDAHDGMLVTYNRRLEDLINILQEYHIHIKNTTINLDPIKPWISRQDNHKQPEYMH